MGATAGDKARGGQPGTRGRENALETILEPLSDEAWIRIFAFAASFDRTERSKPERIAWSQMLRGYTFEQVLQAVEDHYLQSTYRMMPANLKELMDERDWGLE